MFQFHLTPLSYKEHHKLYCFVFEIQTYLNGCWKFYKFEYVLARALNFHTHTVSDKRVLCTRMSCVQLNWSLFTGYCQHNGSVNIVKIIGKYINRIDAHSCIFKRPNRHYVGNP